jgi:hypothetical protein
MYTTKLASSATYTHSGFPEGRLRHSSGPRRYFTVNAAHTATLPTVKEDQPSNFNYDKLKAFTSGALP